MRPKWLVTWLLTYPLAKLLFGIRVTGRRKLVRGAQILACNHVSNIDPLIVGWAAAREVHFLAKEELFRANRFFEWLIRNWNAWPVSRGKPDLAAFKYCSRLLQHGQTLVLFPEGTRSQTGRMARFQPGLGMLGVSNRVPVIPTLLRGIDRSWISYAVDRDFARRGFRHKPQEPTRIHVVFGDPVYPESSSQSRREYVKLARTVEERVRAMAL